MLQNRSVIGALALLVLGFVVLGDAKAAAPSPGASCSTYTANSYACYANGCYRCVSNAWVAQPLYIGATSATCDSTTKQQIRYNTTSDQIELCDGASWRYFAAVTGSVATAPSGVGYFVLTSTTYTGNLGGLFGANASCLTELTSNTNWKYYSDANSAGQLVADKVRGFVRRDNYSTFNGMMPLTAYYFARVGDAAAGGASFTTNSSNDGPADSANWSGATYFNGTYTYWAGGSQFGTSATWDHGAADKTCNGFTSASSGVSGDYGSSNSTGAGRWGNTNTTCDNSKPIICVVNP